MSTVPRMMVASSVATAMIAFGASGAAQSPSTASAKKPMTAAGLPLPLRESEMLGPRFGNGCAAVSIKLPATNVTVKPPSAPQHAFVNKSKWYGACRFGLLHGKGQSEWVENLYDEKEYRYGVELPGLQKRYFKYENKWIVTVEQVFQAFGRPEKITLENWSIAADDGNRRRRLTFVRSGSPLVMGHYSQRRSGCRNLQNPTTLNQDLVTMSDSDQRLVEAQCKSSPNTLLTYITVKHVQLPGGVPFADGKSEHVLFKRSHLCRSLQDCREAWTAAIAPEKLEQLMIELAAAHQAFMVEWEARFAPLEAAFQAKLKRLSAPAAPRRR